VLTMGAVVAGMAREIKSPAKPESPDFAGVII
jgi:hypothetical protein